MTKSTVCVRLLVRHKYYPQAICVKSGDNSGFYVWESYSKKEMIGMGPTATKAWENALARLLEKFKGKAEHE